jgi:hypothetical protein
VVISSGMFQSELDASSNMVGIAYGNSWLCGESFSSLGQYCTKCENHIFVTFGVSLPLKGLIKVSFASGHTKYVAN